MSLHIEIDSGIGEEQEGLGSLPPQNLQVHLVMPGMRRGDGEGKHYALLTASTSPSHTAQWSAQTQTPTMTLHQCDITSHHFAPQDQDADAAHAPV